jgi:hypothetical protein
MDEIESKIRDAVELLNARDNLTDDERLARHHLGMALAYLRDNERKE